MSVYHKTYMWLLCATLLPSFPACAKEAESVLLHVTKAAHSPLTLHDVIAKALARSPRIAAVHKAVLASKGAKLQAGLLQNPEVTMQTENFAGSGIYDGVSRSDFTVSIAQTIERGGKRAGRLAVAQQDVRLSRLQEHAEYLDVIRDTTHAYMNAVAAQEMLALAQKQKTLAQDALTHIGQNVKAARASVLEQSKADIALSTANVLYDQAAREVDHTHHVLSSLWGGHEASIALEKKEFFITPPPLQEAEAEMQIEQNPDYRRMLAEHRRMQAEYHLEKAQAVVDPRFNVGVRHLGSSRDEAFIAGVTVPLPISSQNQGNIARARHAVSKAHSEAQSAKLTLVVDLHDALEKQINAYQQVDTLKTSILPSTQKIFTLSRQGYKVGKLPYTDVLEAQSMVSDVKAQYITALKEYQLAKAEVERLTAMHTGMVTNKGARNEN